MLSTVFALLALFLALASLMLIFGVKADIAELKQQLKRLTPIQEKTLFQEQTKASPPDVAVAPSEAKSNVNYSAYNIEQQIIGWCALLWQKTFGWLFSGNYIAKLGVLTFLVGIVLLVKLATDYGFLSIGWRLCLAGVTGLALLITGWWLRRGRAWYATLLIGAGMGTMYITVYGAYAMYHLIPSSMAICLLIIFSLGQGVLAVLLNAQRLALLGIFAGFLAPILASSGSGNYLILFGYFLALNIGVAYIAYYKSWRMLNLLSFGLTFVLSGLWGFRQFTPEKYLATQLFLCAFILLYTVILLLFARHDHKKGFDRILALGIPIIGFTYQALIVKQFAHGLAFSTLGFAVYYVFLAWFLSKYLLTIPMLLREVMLAFATIFLTLVIPFTFSGEWIGVAWALEGCLIIWLGQRHQKILAILFGTFILCIANVAAFSINAVLTIAVLAVTNYVAAFFLTDCAKLKLQQVWKILSYLIFAIAILWNIDLIYQIAMNYHNDFEPNIYTTINDWFSIVEREFSLVTEISVVFLAVILSYVLIWLSHEKWRWMYLYGLAISNVVIVLGFLIAFMYVDTLVVIKSFILVPLFIFVGVFILQNIWLKRIEKYPLDYIKLLHIFIAATIVLFLTWWIKLFTLDYLGLPHRLENIVYGLIPAIILLGFSAQKIDRLWMVKRYPKQYYGSVGFLLVLYLLFWLLFQNLYISRSHLLPVFMPILNIKDICSLIAVLSITLWIVNKRNLAIISWEESSLQLLKGFFGFVAFLWINAVMLRSMAIYLDLDPFHLFRIQVVQMALSILWAICALVVIFVAHVKQWRKFWIAGGLIVGLIIAKLLLIDFADSNTIERVISFISVGILLLITGYIAPIPPKFQEEQHVEKDLLS